MTALKNTIKGFKDLEKTFTTTNLNIVINTAYVECAEAFKKVQDKESIGCTDAWTLIQTMQLDAVPFLYNKNEKVRKGLVEQVGPLMKQVKTRACQEEYS